MRKLSIALLVVFAVTLAVAQRDKSKRPSQPGTAEVTLGGEKIVIEYSRPKMADPKSGQPRKIMDGLVPYGEVWRTGANEATSLKTDAALDIGGTSVPAGSYTLYTLPKEDFWTLIISKKTGQWGIPYPEGQDFGRYDMKTELIEIPMEKLTISFLQNDKKKDVCTLRIDWEKTRAYVDIAEKK